MTSREAAWSWPLVLNQLVSRRDLPGDGADWAMTSILTGDATSAQIAGFVTALRTKGVIARCPCLSEWNGLS